MLQFDRMPDISSTKAWNMETKWTQKLILGSRIEEDINPLIIFKESNRFQLKNSLVKIVLGC